jgi:DNA-directed RNA polymerase specialized sigma24 family protein
MSATAERTRDFTMRFKTHKTSKKNRDVIVYIDSFGRKTVIKEGDVSMPDNRIITKEDIANYHLAVDAEVRNNNKHNKVRLTEEQEREAKEWEEAHPGEVAPFRYHAHLDQFSDDPDSDMDKSSLMGRIACQEHGPSLMVETLREIIGEMPEKYRYCLIKVKFCGYTLREVADEWGVQESTACRWLQRAIEFITKNEERFNFR